MGHRLGLDCSERTYARLEVAVERRVALVGGPASLVAYSRGGQLGRVLAVRRPELVAGLVTVGTPWRPGIDALGESTRRKIARLGRLGSAGVPGVVTLDCLADGGCCTRFWLDLVRPVAPDLPYVAVHARDDVIVDGRRIGDPAADTHWVDGGHRSLLWRRDVSDHLVRAVQRRRVVAARV